MATKVQVPLEEYLRTSYDGRDREYVDGEIRERGLPNPKHARVQWHLCGVFYNLRSKASLSAFPELRLPVSEERYRVADLAVYRGGGPLDGPSINPPLIVVEILSPDDRMSEVLEKLTDYRRWGVEHVWLIDPESRKLFVSQRGGLLEVEAFEGADPPLRIEASDIF